MRGGVRSHLRTRLLGRFAFTAKIQGKRRNCGQFWRSQAASCSEFSGISELIPCSAITGNSSSVEQGRRVQKTGDPAADKLCDDRITCLQRRHRTITMSPSDDILYGVIERLHWLMLSIDDISFVTERLTAYEQKSITEHRQDHSCWFVRPQTSVGC